MPPLLATPKAAAAFLTLALLPAPAFLVAAVPSAQAAAASPAVYHGCERQTRLVPPRVAQGPVVDGSLDDPVWAEAAVLDSFVHWDPVEGVRDSNGTVCLALYDDHAFYFGFRCPQDPRWLRAPLVKRDEVGEDFVGVDLDTYDDRQRSFVFGCDPNGVQFDGVYQEERGDPDLNPDFLYTSKARLTRDGYEVEIEVPFRILRFPPHNPLRFGFTAYRNIAHTGVFMFWTPQTRNLNSFHAQYGTLDSLMGLKAGHSLQINPTLTGSRLGERLDEGFHTGKATSRGGLGVKYGVTSNLTADAAITPDFSQVEADAGVVDINQRFAIFFPEKRPFFLEGAEVFSTPLNLVYTRRIADPLYGLKLNGKVGRTTVGVLSALDRSGGDSVESLPNAVNPYLDHNAQYDIVRLKQDVLKSSYLGLLMGHREQQETYNRGIGVDGRLNLAERYTLSFQRVQSWSRERDYGPALAKLTAAQLADVDSEVANRHGVAQLGDASKLQLDYGSRRLETGFSFLDLSKHFAADMGFIQRTNQIDFGTWLNPHFDAKGESWFTRINSGIGYNRSYDHADDGGIGRLTDESLNASVHFNLPRNSWFGGSASNTFTYFDGREFPDMARFNVYAGSERFNAVRGGVEVGGGDAIVFDETVPGEEWYGSAWTDLHINRQLIARLNFNGSMVTRAETDKRFADIVISRLRLDYQATRELSLRWISEYRSERDYDTSAALSDNERVLSLDILATWLLRPGTAAYVGYGSRITGERARKMTLDGNNAFVKLSWLWQG